MLGVTSLTAVVMLTWWNVLQVALWVVRAWSWLGGS
jgi:hypothetical protein